MKTALVAALLIATPVFAQDGAARSPLDQPIERIASTQGGCAVLDKDFPGLRAHPMYMSFKRMSLNQIAAMSKGKITPAMMTQAETDLSALPAPETTPVAATAVSAEP